jgi:membrane-associated phospholipid phosphatase
MNRFARPQAAGAGLQALACAATSTAFLGIYAVANHLTARRSDVGSAVFDWEKATPFIAWTIVPYLSICGFFLLSFFTGRDRAALRRHVVRLFAVLLVSVGCYALFPLRFTLVRPPVEGLFGLLFDALAAFDLPYNRAPSLHIAVLVVLGARFFPFLGRAQRWTLAGWFLLIGLSVLTTYQHHLVDVAAGLVLGAVVVAATSAGVAAQASNERLSNQRASIALGTWPRQDSRFGSTLPESS